MDEYWRTEADRELTQGLPPGGNWFLTREEAEQEARQKGYLIVARYRGAPVEMIRRAYPVREV